MIKCKILYATEVMLPSYFKEEMKKNVLTRLPIRKPYIPVRLKIVN